MRTLAPLIAMRAAIWMLSFARVRRLADAMSGQIRTHADAVRPSPDRIAWATATMCRIVPGGDNCLVRALATGIVLKRYCYPSELKIGVTKPLGGRLEAHAWLESGGSVIIGDFHLDRYVPLAGRDTLAQ